MARADIGPRRPSRTPGVIAISIAVAAALSLVGCSSDGTAAVATSTTDSTATSTTAPGPPLVASFEIDLDHDTSRPTSCPLRSITFTDTSTGGPTAWLWEFPDGSTSTEPSPVVRPESGETGEWNGEVTLTVTRGDQTDVATDDIQIAVC